MYQSAVNLAGKTPASERKFFIDGRKDRNRETTAVFVSPHPRLKFAIHGARRAGTGRIFCVYSPRAKFHRELRSVSITGGNLVSALFFPLYSRTSAQHRFPPANRREPTLFFLSSFSLFSFCLFLSLCLFRRCVGDYR